VQEEFRRNTKDGSSSKHDDEEDCALTTKERKGKGKKFQSNSDSKVKKLECGHLATNYPQKKKNKTVVGSAN
jgi:hypothetical protein